MCYIDKLNTYHDYNISNSNQLIAIGRKQSLTI